MTREVRKLVMYSPVDEEEEVEEEEEGDDDGS